MVFFLRAFAEQADETIKNIQGRADLQRRYRGIIRKKKTGCNLLHLMKRLFENAYMTMPKAADLLDGTYPTAKNAVTALVEAGILIQTDITHTSRVFLASEIEESLNAD